MQLGHMSRETKTPELLSTSTPHCPPRHQCFSPLSSPSFPPPSSLSSRYDGAPAPCGALCPLARRHFCTLCSQARLARRVGARGGHLREGRVCLRCHIVADPR